MKVFKQSKVNWFVQDGDLVVASITMVTRGVYDISVKTALRSRYTERVLGFHPARQRAIEVAKQENVSQ